MAPEKSCGRSRENYIRRQVLRLHLQPLAFRSVCGRGSSLTGSTATFARSGVSQSGRLDTNHKAGGLRPDSQRAAIPYRARSGDSGDRSNARIRRCDREIGSSLHRDTQRRINGKTRRALCRCGTGPPCIRSRPQPLGASSSGKVKIVLKAGITRAGSLL